MLAFGILQVSASLNYVYESTKEKLAKISQALVNHEGMLRQLGKQTEEGVEVEKQMREVIQMLKAQMAKQEAQAKMTKDRLAHIEREEAELQTKERAALNGRILNSLRHLTWFQKQNIETYDEQLSKLQMMTESTRELLFPVCTPLRRRGPTVS